MIELSVIIPVFNEEQSVTAVIDGVKKTLNGQACTYEIIVVDDDSSDGTFGIVSGTPGVRVLRHSANKGYGASLKTGLMEARYGWIAIIDGDGTYPAEAFGALLAQTASCDMAVAARIGRKVDIPNLRRPAKWFLTILAGFLAGRKIPDLNSGMRIFRKDLCVRFMHLYPDGFSFTSTITMAFLTHDYEVSFVPVDYYKRKGKSSIKPSHFVSFGRLLLRLSLFFNPIKLFGLISGALFLLAIVVFCFSKFYLGRVMDISVIVILMSSLQIFLFGLLAELIIRIGERK